MTDIEFEQFLHQMSKEDLDKWLKSKGLPFDSFANALAGGTIANLAPPFDEYSNYTKQTTEEEREILGNVISKYE